MLDQTVTVTGIATAPTNLFDDYHLEIFLQDTTGGINVWVYGAASSYSVSLGDSITVTSKVAQYNGLTELGTSTSYTTIINHSTASVMPSAQAITCAELQNTFEGDYSEPNESLLVRLDNLTITSGSWPETPGGNTQIQVDDGTGIAMIYIDQDTPVNGSPQPESGFSIVGIIKQYDSSSPYTSGYQLIPRYVSDIIPPGGATLQLADVRNVTPTSADILFVTSQAGSSEVEYGLTDAYGQIGGDSGSWNTNHAVALTGLIPNTIYHFRVKSTNSGSTDYGPDQLLATASDTPGQIHVMMSHSAEPEYAGSYDEVAAEQTLSVQLALKINQAVSSIDAALYSFSLSNIRGSLMMAHERGCQVRLIIDQNNSTDYAEQCAAIGIPYIVSSYAGNHAQGFMHNKFLILDGRDSDPTNDWVWTGSANMSYYGNYDVNNALLIQDYGLAQAYTFEFNEMWGSDSQVPSSSARMGNLKFDNTPHEFTIAGLRVEQYMSPSDQVTNRIINTVATADYSLYLCLLSFTHNDISLAMRNRRTALGGALQVCGVFDQDQGSCSGGSEYFALNGESCAFNYWIPPADVWLDTVLEPDEYLHHKYMIVDVGHADSDPAVLTGSHNWSYNAESYNDENTLIIHDANVANQYLQEFAARYHESGGTGNIGQTTGVEANDGNRLPDRNITRLSCYPNPFNPLSQIRFETKQPASVSVQIFDARGSLVRTIAADEPTAPGLHIMAWNGQDATGQPMASGTYFARVRTSGPVTQTDHAVVRMLLVK